MNRTVHSPAIDVGAFPNTSNTDFWSATPQSSSTTAVWGVNFDGGRSNLDGNGAANLLKVRCVH